MLWACRQVPPHGDWGRDGVSSWSDVATTNCPLWWTVLANCGGAMPCLRRPCPTGLPYSKLELTVRSSALQAIVPHMVLSCFIRTYMFCSFFLPWFLSRRHYGFMIVLACELSSFFCPGPDSWSWLLLPTTWCMTLFFFKMVADF
jgi:hypothetical protein